MKKLYWYCHPDPVDHVLGNDVFMYFIAYSGLESYKYSYHCTQEGWWLLYGIMKKDREMVECTKEWKPL